MEAKPYNEWLLAWFLNYGLGPRTDEKLPVRFEYYSEKHGQIAISGVPSALAWGHMRYEKGAAVISRTGVEYINLLMREMNDA